MNQRMRLGRQKYFLKFNMSELQLQKVISESQQGRIKEESIRDICLGTLLQKAHKL